MYTHHDGKVPDFFVDLVNEFETNVLPYEPGPCHFTVTSLERGPLEAGLSRLHPDPEKDALDGISSMDGTMLHYGLEMAAESRGDRSEIRRFHTFEMPDGAERILSGCVDFETDNSVLGNVMVDWKRTTAKQIQRSTFPSQENLKIDGQWVKAGWVWQLNVNRYLAESGESFTYRDDFLRDGQWKLDFSGSEGREATPDDYAEHPFFQGERQPNTVWRPDRMFIGAAVKDWIGARRRERNYPKARVVFIEIPFLEDAVVEDYLLDRMQHHHEWEQTHPDDIPRCSPKERWRDPDEWKVYDTTSRARQPRCVKGGKFDNESEAYAHADRLTRETGKPHRVEHFGGVSKKCKMFCDHRKTCRYGGQE